MINYTARFAKRFAVLLPGILITYVAVHTIYPLFDKRVSAILAILFTYILTAYLLIPAAIRFLRLFKPARHLPLYCITPDGFASDPLNVGIIGTKQQLIDSMQAAGWSTADKHTLSNIIRAVISTILDRQYKTAPMSSLYLFGRPQDIGFELLNDQRGHRHHVRFWATTFEPDQPLNVDTIHWLPLHRHHHADGVMLWLGAASQDVGLAFIRHNAQLTHMIHPDTDKERDLITRQLASDGATLLPPIHLQRPYKITNRVWRGYLQTDGTLQVCKL